MSRDNTVHWNVACHDSSRYTALGRTYLTWLGKSGVRRSSSGIFWIFNSYAIIAETVIPPSVVSTRIILSFYTQKLSLEYFIQNMLKRIIFEHGHLNLLSIILAKRVDSNRAYWQKRISILLQYWTKNIAIFFAVCKLKTKVNDQYYCTA